MNVHAELQGKPMGTYINTKCGSCNKSLTGGYVADYFTIGEPVIECSSCGSLNSHQDNCTEWELMSGYRKMFFLSLLTISSAFWAVALFFIILVASLGFLGDISEVGMIVSAIASLAICFSYRFGGVSRLIAESRERMKDIRYRSKLESLGIIR